MKFQIYIDGWCPNCRRFSRWIKKLDVFEQIEILDIRKDHHPSINKEQALKAMASIDAKGIAKYGFPSIYSIFKTLPILWTFVPFLYMLKILKLGDFLYNEFAIMRKIIPLHCDEISCFKDS